MKGGSAANNIVRNNVGDEGGGEVPKRRGYVQRIVLIRAQKTLSERTSCNGQSPMSLFSFSFRIAEVPRVDGGFNPIITSLGFDIIIIIMLRVGLIHYYYHEFRIRYYYY